MKVSPVLNEQDQTALADLGFSSVSELVRLLRKSFVTFCDPLLATDVYKECHMEMMKPGVTKIVAYLFARSDREYKYMVSAGLTHLITTYMARRITPAMCEQLIRNKEAVGALAKATQSTIEKSKRMIRSLAGLGYIPLEIRAVPEGTVMKAKNLLATIENTHPDFAWCVGFFESLILKMWEAMATASCVFAYRRLVDYWFGETVTDELSWLREYIVHDFGYRACGTEEGAQTTGAAQLLFSKGSDTVPAREYVIRLYDADPASDIMYSPPASEHAVACSFGLHYEGEREYVIHALTTYKGVVSIVGDSKSIYNFVFMCMHDAEIRQLILSREGKTVFRPDSGNPFKVLCGDEGAPVGSMEWLGVIRLLDLGYGEAAGFGHTTNLKGYKYLNEKVGVIYGDGMFLKRYARVLLKLASMKYASSNLVIGVGGILRMHTRDTQGVTLKDVYMVINGEEQNIRKDPVTDPGKRSHCGLPAIVLDENGDHVTIDECTKEQYAASLTVPVFLNGEVLNSPMFADMRARAAYGLAKYPMGRDEAMELATL